MCWIVTVFATVTVFLLGWSLAFMASLHVMARWRSRQAALRREAWLAKHRCPDETNTKGRVRSGKIFPVK